MLCPLHNCGTDGEFAPILTSETRQQRNDHVNSELVYGPSSFFGLFLVLMRSHDSRHNRVGNEVLKPVFTSRNKELILDVDVMLGAVNGSNPSSVNRTLGRLHANGPTGSTAQNLQREERERKKDYQMSKCWAQ